MPCTIQNREKRLAVYNLTSPEIRARGDKYGHRQITVGTVDEDKKGNRRVRATRKMAPAALTFLAGERKHGLPLSILTCPEIRHAIDLGRLRVLEQSEDETPAPKAPTRIAPPEKLDVVQTPATSFVSITETKEPIILDDEV